MIKLLGTYEINKSKTATANIERCASIVTLFNFYAKVNSG
jgi:hypothetical protein